MPPTNSDAKWEIECRCRWCGEAFIRMEIDRAHAWVCPTEACRERQLAWKRVDLGGNLFYLPMPVQVELHDAIQSQAYGSICLGGERGSSKSIGMRNAIYNACDPRPGSADPVLPDFSVLLFRKELGELELNQWRFMEKECPRIGATWAAKKIVFPKTGAEIRPAHNNQPNDYRKYIGGDVDLIAIEQAEEFTQKPIAEIGAATGRNTRYGSDWRGLSVVTENPGGPLSDFINQIYVRKDLDRAKYPNYNPANYCFIEHRLADNPYTDARYEQNLALLSPARRAMMRHGRRDVFEGQFFDEFLKEKHVTPFRPVIGAHYFRALRFGYNREGFVLWIAVETSRRMTVAAVLPLEKLNEDAVVARIAKMDLALGVHPRYTVANPEIFGNDPSTEGFSGQTIAETLGLYGCPVICGDADVLNGNKRLHSVLRDAPDTIPWLRVHDSCAPLIQALQQAMSDDKDPDLIADESPNLYAVEALRLAMMSRPAPELAPSSTVYPDGTAGYYLEKAKREARQRVA